MMVNGNVAERVSNEASSSSPTKKMKGDQKELVCF
jgi:hypothetical protein